MCTTRFGTKDVNHRKERKEQTPKRRERRIRECHQELKELNKLFRRANDWGKSRNSTADGCYQVRTFKTTESGATEAEEEEEEKSKARFLKINRFMITKEHLGEGRSGTLHCSKKEVEGYLHKTHSDPMREEPLGQCPHEVKVDPPEAMMNVKEQT